RPGSLRRALPRRCRRRGARAAGVGAARRGRAAGRHLGCRGPSAGRSGRGRRAPPRRARHGRLRPDRGRRRRPGARGGLPAARGRGQRRAARPRDRGQRAPAPPPLRPRRGVRASHAAAGAALPALPRPGPRRRLAGPPGRRRRVCRPGPPGPRLPPAGRHDAPGAARRRRRPRGRARRHGRNVQARLGRRCDTRRMTDTLAARRFVTLHARLIDRRRMDGDPALIRSALAAYRNPDGGFGYLEPDLPDPAGQPITALAALELLHEIGAAPDDPFLVDLAGWLETVTHPDGGLDFVLPFDADAIPHAPWMTPPPDRASSLHMTAAVTAAAHRAGMAAGPGRAWLDRASAFVWRRLDDLDPRPGYEWKYVIDFLDAVADPERAEPVLDTVAKTLGGRESIPVTGGAEGEVITALTAA